MIYEGHSHQKFGHISYSQHGEDMLIVSLLDQMGLDKPSYLDLGAHHPITISNTALLHARGSRGVNVEANPHLMPAFFKERPCDTNICSGVGTAPGLGILYMVDHGSAINTLRRETAEENAARPGYHNPVREKLTVNVVTLEYIINEYCDGSFPDFLNCDIEDYDYPVLEAFIQQGGISRCGQPFVICVEVRREQEKAMALLLERAGYRRIVRMQSNVIYALETPLDL